MKTLAPHSFRNRNKTWLLMRSRQYIFFPYCWRIAFARNLRFHNINDSHIRNNIKFNFPAPAQVKVRPFCHPCTRGLGAE